MALKNRIELEAHFKNLRRPSQEEFGDLIRSMLNKRDDQFFGRWQPGSAYRTGDIVVHDRSLWELADDGAGGALEICSHDEPGTDDAWRSLVVPVEDDDWFLVDLEPAEGAEEEDPLPASMHANPRVLRVGIGTDDPAGTLEVLDAGRGRLVVDPGEGGDAELCLARAPLEGDARYFAAVVGEELASLLTDAPAGFAFQPGEPRDDGCRGDPAERGPVLVAVRIDGKVGVGTAEPRARLEVTNQKSGTFLFNLDRKVNPALGIVNLRPGCRENYLAVGVDNDSAALVTDSHHGFLFRAGGESGVDDHEVDINQGRVLVWIRPDGHGKVGIGRQPQDYQVDANGLARSYGHFTDVDESNLGHVRSLPPILDTVKDLRPVYFEWEASTGLEGEGERVGFVAHEVDDVCPQAVKTNGDRTKAVDYGSLVAVLVKAVQEQQETIEALSTRLDDVEERLAALEE